METKKSLLNSVLETLVQLLCVLDLSKLKILMKSNKIYITFAILKLLVILMLSSKEEEKNELKQVV